MSPLLLLFTMMVMLSNVVGRTGGHYSYIARLASLVVLSTTTMAAAISAAEFYRELHEGMFAPMLLLFFLPSGSVPLTDFPAVIQPIVHANPLSTADNALIALSAGGPATSAVLQTLAWALGVSAVCAFAASRQFAHLARY